MPDIFLYPGDSNASDVILRDPTVIHVDGAAATDGAAEAYSVTGASASGEGQATGGSVAEGLSLTAAAASGGGTAQAGSSSENITPTGAAGSGEGNAGAGSSAEAITASSAAASGGGTATAGSALESYGATVGAAAGEGVASAGSALETIALTGASASGEGKAITNSATIAYTAGQESAFSEETAQPTQSIGGVFKPLHVASQRLPKKTTPEPKQDYPKVDGRATCEGVYTYIKVSPGIAGGDAGGKTPAGIILGLAIGKTVGSGEALTITEGVLTFFSVNESEGAGELDEGELLDILRITHRKEFVKITRH